MPLTILIFLAGGVALAENIDPGGTGSQYAWAENVGWINAEPGGNGGPGVQVDDVEITGYMWGENIGWVSLSCQNTASCGTGSYGVHNDTCGHLTGYAWGENVGWVSFSCLNTSSCGTANYGVIIDPQTGDFSGNAWGENVGWITFSSSGPNPYKVTTSWRRFAPTGAPSLSADKNGGNLVLQWFGISGAEFYEIIRGSLGALASSGGNFTVAVDSCTANTGQTTATLPLGSGTNSDFFIVRAVNCGGRGSADEGGSQVGSRDSEIAASGLCP
jgi:hypothetical protein